MINEGEWDYQWGFKNGLQQTLPPTLSLSDVQTSNKQFTINISIYNIYKLTLTDTTNICDMSAIYGDFT